MKVMVVGTLLEMTAEQQAHYVPLEVAAILKLYLDGKMEQFWGRLDVPGAVILVDVASLEEAQSLFHALPFFEPNLVKFEFLPVGPLSPLGMLL